MRRRRPGSAMRAIALGLAWLVAAGPAIAPRPAGAVTARSLGGRIVIDGSPAEYTVDEALFGPSPIGGLEEPVNDSAWGPDNDFNQFHVTWDRDSIYVTGEGVIWGNNMVVLFDVVPGRGMESMRNLRSWARNFVFSDDFRPDLFLATWDGNTSPRLLIHQGGTDVSDSLSGSSFRGTASFSTSQRGRCMEYAIPWDTFFLGPEGFGVERVFSPSLGETLNVFPAGSSVRIAGVITGGADNTGGPDTAPDNTRGHVTDGSREVLVDNWVQVDLDRLDDSGLGAGGPDGVADWGVEPKARATFKIQPPVIPVRLEVVGLTLDRPAFAPDRGQVTRLRFAVDPPPVPGDPLAESRTVNVTANVFDSGGRFVRNLFVNAVRTAVAPIDSTTDYWDGRDESGELVPGGVYVVRLVVEPSLSRVTRPVVVVR